MTTRPVLWHPSERMDKADLDGMTQFSQAVLNQHHSLMVLDRQCRVLRGFRVELADQTLYPGRIVLHGGAAMNPSGQVVFNEDEAGISRTITLEGANTTFFLEVEFVEADSDIDARALWDPTVEQTSQPSGDPNPPGQEFSANIPSRRLRDWRIVQPVRVGAQGFERDQAGTIMSNKIPIIKLKTDANNKITSAVNTGLTQEKVPTILLQYMSSTQIRVQDATCLPSAGSSLVIGENVPVAGGYGEETVTISAIDRSTGLITVTPMALAHNAGEVIRGSGTIPEYITEDPAGRYRKLSSSTIFASTIDHKDRMWQGDTLHGSILSHGFGSLTARADTNIQTLKDYVDFLAAQIQELKWGSNDPFVGDTDASRKPPGFDGTTFPTTPNYYDRTGGLSGTRIPTVTIGDGVTSFGDFNGQDEVVFQAAHDAFPGTYGTGLIYVKPGSYTLNNNVNVTKNVGYWGWAGQEESSGGAIEIKIKSGCFNISGSYDKNNSFRNIAFSQASSNTTTVAIQINKTSGEVALFLYNCYFSGVRFTTNRALLPYSRIENCIFEGSSEHAGIPMIATTGSNGAIMGLFRNCFFDPSYTEGSVIGKDDGTAAPVASTLFDNCWFMEGGTDTTFLLRIFPQEVSFRNCTFYGIDEGDYTLAAVYLDGGSDAMSVEFIGCTAYNQLLYSKQVDGVIVNGLRSYTSVNDKWVLAFEDCSRVEVDKCIMKTCQASSYLLGGGIYLKYTANVRKSSVHITNNNIMGKAGYQSTSHATGVLFDFENTFSTYATIQGVTIKGNTFDLCEAGVLFLADYTQIMPGCQICGNTFMDLGVDGGTGKNMVVGIYVHPNVVPQGMTIVGNVFEGLNTSTRIDAQFANGYRRIGVWIDRSGSATAPPEGLTISGNSFRHIGMQGAYGDIAGYGVVVTTAYGLVISDNSFSQINTRNAIAIPIGVGDIMEAGVVGMMANITISGNTIIESGGITSVGSADFTGICIAEANLENISITGNTIYITSYHQYTGILVNGLDSALTNLSISGNSIKFVPGGGSTQAGIGIYLRCSNGVGMRSVSISGNSIEGAGTYAMEKGIYAENIIYGLSITGNNIRNERDYAGSAQPFGIHVRGQSGVIGDLWPDATVISGNQVWQYYGPCIYVKEVNGVAINGNNCRCVSLIIPSDSAGYKTGNIFCMHVKMAAIVGNVVANNGSVSGSNAICIDGTSYGFVISSNLELNSRDDAAMSLGNVVDTEYCVDHVGGLITQNVGNWGIAKQPKHETNVTDGICEYYEYIIP